jgi:7,8-dihydropterin-6-yl-methyl-4-(beta-D-ribofuranosyl)aminobenzene 5'-phosphate synthase
MQCRITTLAENTAGKPYLIGEWGFCAYVETPGLTVLCDAGVGSGATWNAEWLGVDLTTVDKVFVSHSHFDHTEGLPSVLRKIHKDIDVIAAPDLWEGQKFSIDGRVRPKLFIGIPYTRPFLENWGARFTLTREPVHLSDNVMTSGEIPLVTDFEKVGEDYLVTEIDGKLMKDDFIDDRFLIIRTTEGLVLVLGCGHRALINSLLHARRITGEDRIHAVIGGCHLIDASDERIMKTIEALKQMDVHRVGVSHCTGLRAAAMMANELGDRFFFNTVGTRVEVP